MLVFASPWDYEDMCAGAQHAGLLQLDLRRLSGLNDDVILISLCTELRPNGSSHVVGFRVNMYVFCTCANFDRGNLLRPSSMCAIYYTIR